MRRGRLISRNRFQHEYKRSAAPAARRKKKKGRYNKIPLKFISIHYIIIVTKKKKKQKKKNKKKKKFKQVKIKKPKKM